MTVILLILIVILLGGGWLLLLPFRAGLAALGLSVFGPELIDFFSRNGETLATIIVVLTVSILIAAVVLRLKVVSDAQNEAEYWRLRGGLEERFSHVPCPYCGKKKMKAAVACPSCNQKSEVAPRPEYWIFHSPS